MWRAGEGMLFCSNGMSVLWPQMDSARFCVVGSVLARSDWRSEADAEIKS